MATSNHIVGHSNTTQSIDDGSTPSNSERVYETGAFSTNVTPPLNFKHVSHILNISTGPTASTSSSSAPTRHPLFGGASRATDFTEVSYNVALASSSQNGESLSLYNGKRPGESTTTARRLSFTALKALEGHGQGFEMHGHRSHAYKEAGGAVKGGREDQATLPVIPDELMAVLALPPGSSINANAFTKQDALVSDRSLRIESNEGSMRKTSTLPSTSRNIPRAPNVPSIAPSLNNMLSPGSLAPRLTGSSSNTSVHQRRSLRKAASAESLQTAASVRNGVNTSTDVDSMLANMRGLGIIATNSTVTASFLPSFNDAGNTSTDGTGSSSSSARDLTSASRHPTTGQLPSRTTDVKSIWKSFSSKLPGRSLTTTGTSSSGNNVNNGKEKERDMSSTFTQFLKNDTGNSNLSAHYPDGKVLRKSFESTVRHSLSIYPRSRIDKDNLQLRTTRTEDDRCINNRPSEDKTASNIVAGATSQVSLSKSEVDSVSGESHWMSREQFTHDLSQRSKKHHKPITSSHGPAAAGRNSRNILNPPANGVVDDEQEELDDEDEDENEEDDQASQLSFIDPIHLGPSTSLPSLGEHDENEVNENMQAQESRLHDSGGRHHVPQPQPRRNTSPDNMPKSMAASLQRNRADSTVILPPRISTDLPPSITLNEVTKTNDTTTASNLDSSPPRLTPDTASTVYMDAFSSPLLSGPLSPARNGSSFSYFPNTSPPSDNAVQSKQDSENSNISAIRPIVSGPPSPVYTVRPRSMSESFLPVSASSAAQGGNGGGIMEVRAPQPNKSNILNVSLADRRIVQTEEDQPLMRLNEKQQGEVGQLSDVPPALTGVSVGICRDGNGESSGNTTTSSSFDLSRSSPNSKKSNAQYTVALVGPKQVGKSTIIAQNLKLSSDKCTVLYEDVDGNKVLSYYGSYSITGKSCILNVLEVDMDVLHNTSEGLSWPANVPRPEGVMICYKYGDPKGLEHLKTLLHGFWTRGGIHLIALATQCPPVQESSTPYKAEGDKAAEICNIHGAGLVHLDGGIGDPNRKARNSLQWILRKIVESRGQGSRSPSRMKKSVVPKRSVATLIAEKADGQNLSTILTSPISENVTKSNSDAGHSLNTVSTTSGNSGFTGDALLDEKFLLSKLGHSQMDIYLSPEDLVQKLLFAAVAGNDEEYIASFLIVYRRFETPYKLLHCWLERFQLGSQHHNDDPLLSRYVQMKLCNLLARWVKFHRNDFCSSKTVDLLKVVLETLYACSWVHHYAIEIEELAKDINGLSDQDARWTLPDQQEESPLHNRLASIQTDMERKPSLAPSLATTISLPSLDQSLFTSLDTASPATTSFGAEVLHAAENTAPTMTSIERTPSRSSSKKKSTLASVVSSEMFPLPSNRSLQQSQKLEVMLDISDTFLDSAVQPVAVQITRQSWDMFASMQPRDLLRYVMTPRDPKNPDLRPQRNADNPVTKAVAFSNYLSNWTASVLLVQSKPKARARAFEHLIRLALALRNLDNLDCLMAVLVGLNSTPVHRLNELATSIPENVYKKFRSMNFLMASTRSFAAYRLALTTARPEVIPYLGVHLQDITRVHDGKSDMRDGLVNWSKMRQIAKYASAVAHCGRPTPHYPHDERLSKLVMDAPVFSLDDDDDSLYELSYSYRPRQKRSGSGSHKDKLKRLLKEANQYTRMKLAVE